MTLYHHQRMLENYSLPGEKGHQSAPGPLSRNLVRRNNLLRTTVQRLLNLHILNECKIPIPQRSHLLCLPLKRNENLVLLLRLQGHKGLRRCQQGLPRIMSMVTATLLKYLSHRVGKDSARLRRQHKDLVLLRTNLRLMRLFPDLAPRLCPTSIPLRLK